MRVKHITDYQYINTLIQTYTTVYIYLYVIHRRMKHESRQHKNIENNISYRPHIAKT